MLEVGLWYKMGRGGIDVGVSRLFGNDGDK